MKHLIICMVIIIASLSTINGQISLNMEGGISSNKTPTVGSNLQANIHGFIIAAGFDAQISRKVSNGNLYWLRGGKSFNLSELNQLEVSAGISQYRRSSDVKSLNERLPVANVQFVHQLQFREEAALFAGITTTNQFFFVSGGIRFIFGRGANGCPSTRIR